MTNTEIARLLRNVAVSYTIINDKKYRFQIIAYQRASDAIEGTSTQLQDLYKDNKLEDIPGIGPSIRTHLEELFRTGEVKHFNFVMENIPKAVFLLMEIPTFGPKKAYRLAIEFELKIRENPIENIYKLAKKGEIAKLDGFGEKSEQDIIRAIEEFRQGLRKTTRMPLPYALEIAKNLLEYLQTCPEVKIVRPLGSLRRQVETIGDIDFAVATEKPQIVIDHFISYPLTDRIIEKGQTTASILLTGGTQIDLMTQPEKSFGALLQHFTGSKNHNVRLREIALKKGLSLSEYGIKKQGSAKIESYVNEEDFYCALDMSWIPPEIRENKGEIELALQHNLPKLVELPDIKGDLHIHSNFPIEPSHDMGNDNMESMLKKGEMLGYSYLGFSEHNPSVSKHTNKQMYEILARRKEKIDRLNASKKYIKAISLLELDILANGKLAIDDKCLSLLDAVLVSIHSSFSMDKETMTKRILSGLSHPKARILTHPTGRLINTRPGYEIDFDKILEFCKKYDKALEINAWPQRLDLRDTMVRTAVEQKVKIMINTDSHDLSHMDIMRYGVSVARRGWATRHDILNTLSYNKFYIWLCGREVNNL